MEKKYTPAELTDQGICPTCYDRENNFAVYGDNSCNVLYENELFECFLITNPRSDGHTVISSKKHYKDMMESPDDLLREMIVFSKKCMNILREVYGAESVYFCTMCDGPMNHFHVQLIPRYSYEKRGSKNFVKERKDYVYDSSRISVLRDRLSDKE